MKPKSNGDHDLHVTGCYYMPQPKDCMMLGEFPTCQDALESARGRFTKVNGCYFCARECHRSTS